MKVLINNKMNKVQVDSRAQNERDNLEGKFKIAEDNKRLDEEVDFDIKGTDILKVEEKEAAKEKNQRIMKENVTRKGSQLKIT